MIQKWVLNNFKSVSREKAMELEFRPLTIFSGANSSGKSTILQSILLVAQTLQDPIASRSIVLNGGIKKFGTYTDIVNRRDIGKNITIGFSLYNPFVNAIVQSRRPTPEDDILTNCRFEISSNNEDECLQPLLVKMHLDSNAIGKVEKVSEMDLFYGEEKTEDEKELMGMLAEYYPPLAFDYRLYYKTSRNRFFDYRIKEKHVAVGLKHFFPDYLVAYNTKKEIAKKYLANYLSSLAFMPEDVDADIRKFIIASVKEKAFAIVEEIKTKKKYIQWSRFEQNYDALHKGRFTLNKLREALMTSAIDALDMQRYISQLQSEIDDAPLKKEFTVRVGRVVNNVPIDAVVDYFGQHIKYLGPLREEPRSLYPIEGGGSPNDVGLKGENTAAVLYNNRNTMVEYVDPDCIKDTAHLDSVVKVDKLSVAIKKWLVYLGVASDVNTGDMGKYGHELKITSEIEDMQQDLTHVGVGVSQVLPILTMSLVARKGDVIILEQPELHLHPKVQTRLADFFVSMNALGKQCLIETHSEYMINRLRYHVAVADDSKVADDTMIYFVEKDKATGNSNYRPVTINRYGVIEDWPEGFFDESERLARDILEAGMAKKMKEEDDYEE